MTMPARRASKFSAKRRALLPEVFFQSLILKQFLDFANLGLNVNLEKLDPRGWGNRLAARWGNRWAGGLKAFLIRESKNPFRQAWLGNYLRELV